MHQLTVEQIEYALGRLVSLVEFRGITQTELQRLSDVNQSTISKILSHSNIEGGESYCPSEEVLTKLFQALGLKLRDILNETDCLPEKIFGYLATPLTALDERSHQELKRVVRTIRELAAGDVFDPPPFDIYWPGDFTHPVDHAAIPASQVYIADRSRASTHDFIVLLCVDPSYGVGQENEIATQSGIPAIRLIPKGGLSRMMLGSFVRAIDIKYDGDLQRGISIPKEETLLALREIRKIYFRHRALYRGLNSDAFGNRLSRLVADRCGNYSQFADDLGIDLSYLHTLMREPFSVSNPSARLLNRIAARLGTHVGYLLGESEEADPIWVESNTAWRQWVDSSSGIDARIALEMRDKWRSDYQLTARTRDPSATSYRSGPKLMKVSDWDMQYQQMAKSQNATRPTQKNLI